VLPVDPETLPFKVSVLVACPCPQVACPEKVFPAASGHGGDATGELKVQVVPNSGTVSASRNTPELLNSRLVVVEELVHCCIPAVVVTVRGLCAAAAVVVVFLPIVRADEPVPTRLYWYTPGATGAGPVETGVVGLAPVVAGRVVTVVAAPPDGAAPPAWAGAALVGAAPAAGWPIPLVGGAAVSAAPPAGPPGAAALDGPETVRSEAAFLADPDEHATVAALTPTASAATAILRPTSRRDPM
jgi:hypothetical protein